MSARFEGIRIGVAMCGSFCTFKKVFNTVKLLREQGADIIPIMSFNAASLSTRFGRAEENLALFEELAGKRAIITIEGAEPIGPKDMTDVMLLPNCTGNTWAELRGQACNVHYRHTRHHGGKKPSSGRQARCNKHSHQRRPFRLRKEHRGAYEFKALLLCAA